MEFIFQFENIADKTTETISGTMKDLTQYIILNVIKKLQDRFPFYKKFPNAYGDFIQVNLNPWLLYIYACQLISKYKIDYIIEQDFKQEDLKTLMYTDKYQKNFTNRFNKLKEDITENLKFTARFCGQLKYKYDFNTSEFGIFEIQTINSDEIDLNGFKLMCRTFGIKPGDLTMSNDNHLLKTYAKRIVELHNLIELYQSIIHPKMLEMLTEYTEMFLLNSLRKQTKNVQTTYLINSKNFKKYKFIDSDTYNYFKIYDEDMIYCSNFKHQKLIQNNSFKPSFQKLVMTHLETIKKLYGGVLNFNMPAFSLLSSPYDTELFDFMIDYTMFERKYSVLCL